MKDLDATTRNIRSVWQISVGKCKDHHFAAFPPEIPRRCILLSTAPGETVLDPFGGTGTTGRVAESLGRRPVLIEMSPASAALCRATNQPGLL